VRQHQYCVDCHFLVKENRQHGGIPNVFTLTDQERAKARADDFSWVGDWTLACHLGVWDEGYRFGSQSRGRILTQTERRGFCFFWKYRPGMLLPAAKILQEREAQYREARRDRLLTICGLWIAVAALIANIWLTWAESQGAWPF